MNQLAPLTASYAPALVAASGPRASYRFSNSSPPISATRTRAGPMRARLSSFSIGSWRRGVTQLAGNPERTFSDLAANSVDP